MDNFVIFMIFVVALAFAVSIAISIYLATNKGLSFKTGFMFGLVPIFGQIAIALKSENDSKIVQEMYARNLLTLEDYEKTMEVVIKKETQEVKVKNKKH